MTSASVARAQVLIIEDDDDSRDIYEEILALNGFEVATAVSGFDGLRKAQDGTASAIILDISIPDIDGWTIASRLKDHPATSGIPVVVVTAHTFPEDRLRAESIGCEAFLTKPCSPGLVLSEVQRVIAQSDSSHGHTPAPAIRPTG